MSAFWREYAEFFQAEDGSLPEIRLTGILDAHLGPAFDLIRASADSLSDVGFWDLKHGCEGRVADVPNAAALVAAGAAEAFHILVHSVRVGGVYLPDLGVFVLRGELALDYQPGPEWDASRFYALLDLVCMLKRIAPEATISTEPEVVDHYRRAFEQEVAQYCDGVRAI